MSAPKHLKQNRPCETYFVTANAFDKRHIFQSDRLATLLIQTLYDYRTQSKFLLHAFVVMPNHLHVLFTTGPAITLERCVQLVKGGFSFRAKSELGIASELWQRGYADRRVRDVREFAALRDYVHCNPVRARLAPTEKDFPWSSACGKFELDDCPFTSAAKAGH